MKFILISLLLIIPGQVFSKKAEISFSGWGETGFLGIKQNIVNGPPVSTYYAAKMQADIKFNKEIDAQIDVKGDSSDSQIDFNEFSLKFDYYDYFKVKVGRLKQPFGYEQQTGHSKSLTFNRSNAHNAMARLGYANRSVAVKGYYNFSKKRPDFPYSYAVSVFRNNSNQSGINLKASQHANDIVISGYFQFQKRVGRDNLDVYALGSGSDVIYKTASTSIGAGLFILEDPIAKFQNLEQNTIIESASLDLEKLDESVIAGAFQSFIAYRINTNADVIQIVEPVLMTSLYLPNLEESKSQERQVAFGFNAYFTKDVRFRCQVDYLFTKKETSEQSSISGTSIEIGLQASF